MNTLWKFIASGSINKQKLIYVTNLRNVNSFTAKNTTTICYVSNRMLKGKKFYSPASSMDVF